MQHCHHLTFFYSQAIKECIHHATSLCEGVLQVGTLGWPLEVPASHISQLQFAAALENIMDTAHQQVWELQDVKVKHVYNHSTFNLIYFL